MRHKWIVIAALCVLLFARMAAAAYVTDELQERLDLLKDGEQIPVNVVLKVQAQPSELAAVKSGLDRISSRFAVSDYLKALASSEQAVLLDYLEEMELKGAVSWVNPLWIVNCISIRATGEVVRRCARFPEVARITLNVKRKVLPEKDWNRIDEKRMFTTSRADTAWGVKWIRAHEAWELYGVKGESALVAVLDTGTDYNHSDLINRVWHNPGEIPNNSKDDDGNGYIDDYYGYDFGSHDSNPMDDYGHGTHVAGTVAGDGSAGILTGVAPATTIQILKVLTYGNGDEEDVWEALQYCVDNGTTNATGSIGWWHLYHNPDRPSWRTVCENTVAAGVALTFCVGNERGYFDPPYMIRTPGDVPCVMGIGATGYKTDHYASFSSEGPTYWDDYPYPPGLVKPDICAPGESVNSTVMGGGYSGDTWSGTSMATPHVAGLIALMITANPASTPEEIRSCLESTAIDQGSPGKDNDYGYGRVDAVEAVGCILGEGLQLFVEDHPSTIRRRELLSCTVGVRNFGSETEYFDKCDAGATGPASLIIPLYEGNPIALPAGETRTARVTYRIPPQAPLGDYSIAVTIYMDEIELATTSFEIEIVN
jgi:serine protease AprX